MKKADMFLILAVITMITTLMLYCVHTNSYIICSILMMFVSAGFVHLFFEARRREMC